MNHYSARKKDLKLVLGSKAFILSVPLQRFNFKLSLTVWQMQTICTVQWCHQVNLTQRLCTKLQLHQSLHYFSSGFQVYLKNNPPPPPNLGLGGPERSQVQFQTKYFPHKKSHLSSTHPPAAGWVISPNQCSGAQCGVRREGGELQQGGVATKWRKKIMNIQ